MQAAARTLWLDWCDGRLGVRQKAAAGAASVATLAVYCDLSGLASGHGWHPPLSLAWATLATAILAATGAALVAARARCGPSRFARGVVGALVLAAGVAAFVAGEKLLGLWYFERPWSGFAAAYVARLPLAAIVVAFVDGPAWFARRSERIGEAVLEVPTRAGIERIPARLVTHVTAAGNYVELHTGGRTLLLRATVAALSETLSAAGFVRIHRSVLVNCRYVAAVGATTVGLRDGTRLGVGRRYRAALDDLRH